MKLASNKTKKNEKKTFKFILEQDTKAKWFCLDSEEYTVKRRPAPAGHQEVS